MKHARPDYNRIQDPLGIIPEDEPVFLIRGQDICGPNILYRYAQEAKEMGAHDDLVSAVLKQAKEMKDWQKKTFKKHNRKGCEK